MKITFPVSLNEVKFTIKRNMCYGTCPVYHLTLDGFGNVAYNGILHVKVMGIKSKKIDQKEVLHLFDQVMDFGILEMESVYEFLPDYSLDDGKIVRKELYITDMPSVDIEIQIGSVVKKIHNYIGAPQRLKKFQDLMDEICGSIEWIG